jgi:hypothetical protein
MQTPWHIWPIGAATLALHGLAALDFCMAWQRNATYLSALPAPLRAGFTGFLDAMPLWAELAWALAAFGALAGSLLLLLVSRHAVACFAVALIGLAGQVLYALFLASPPLPPALQSGTRLASLIGLVVLLSVMAYARRLFQQGILR